MMRLATFALLMAFPVAAQPVLTTAEQAVFRTQVQGCWLVKEGAAAVKIGFSLDRDGRPDAESLRLISQGKGSAEQIAQSFAAAKRAVLRCGQEGYTLPVEKYEQWRDIELMFDPERTILR